MSKLTVTEMKKILQTEIPINELVVDNGIYEFYFDNKKSIGVSYEYIDDTGYPVYIFNIFVNDNYNNVPGAYCNVCDAASDLTEAWNNLDKE